MVSIMEQSIVLNLGPVWASHLLGWFETSPAERSRRWSTLALAVRTVDLSANVAVISLQPVCPAPLKHCQISQSTRPIKDLDGLADASYETRIGLWRLWNMMWHKCVPFLAQPHLLLWLRKSEMCHSELKNGQKNQQNWTKVVRPAQFRDRIFDIHQQKSNQPPIRQLINQSILLPPSTLFISPSTYLLIYWFLINPFNNVYIYPSSSHPSLLLIIYSPIHPSIDLCSHTSIHLSNDLSTPFTHHLSEFINSSVIRSTFFLPPATINPPTDSPHIHPFTKSKNRSGDF